MINEEKIIKSLNDRIDVFIEAHPKEKGLPAVEIVKEFIHMLQEEAAEQAKKNFKVSHQNIPFYLGDIVYLITCNNTCVSEAVIYSFKYYKGIIMVNLLCDGKEIPVSLNDFGTVFFTDMADAHKYIEKIKNNVEYMEEHYAKYICKHGYIKYGHANINKGDVVYLKIANWVKNTADITDTNNISYLIPLDEFNNEFEIIK